MMMLTRTWLKRSRRLLVVVAVLLLTVISLKALPSRAAPVGQPQPTCLRQTLLVALAPDEPATYRIASWLCWKGPSLPNTVQVLVSGGSYSHVYWDFSYEPERYSYLKSIVAAGYAAFNFDRIGIGESDHPLSELVSVQSNAYVIHQLIQALRSGQVGGVPFGKVMLVGHSLGSAICLYVASYYQGDVDGVIITGFLHWFNPAMIPILGADIYSVQLDPQFAGQHYPAGYLTTRPGTRGDLFHYLPNTDPSVLATDEATKGSFTDAEAASFFALVSSTDSQQIQVPVLIAVGRYDRFFCAGNPLIDCTDPSTVQRYEAPFYAPAATLQVVIVDNAGHDINLQQNAPTWFAQAINWAVQKVGQ